MKKRSAILLFSALFLISGVSRSVEGGEAIRFRGLAIGDKVDSVISAAEQLGLKVTSVPRSRLPIGEIKDPDKPWYLELKKDGTLVAEVFFEDDGKAIRLSMRGGFLEAQNASVTDLASGVREHFKLSLAEKSCRVFPQSDAPDARKYGTCYEGQADTGESVRISEAFGRGLIEVTKSESSGADSEPSFE
jgi:hypothetical protein